MMKTNRAPRLRRLDATGVLIAVALGLLTLGQKNAAAASAGPPSKCKASERLLQPSGLCGKRSVEGCFDAAVQGPDSAASTVAGAASPVEISVVNNTGALLYFKAARGARRIDFSLRRSVTTEALTPQETQFCPVLCPQSGAVMETDCGAPVPALFVVRPGASASIDWSGQLAVETARACNEGLERRCHVMRAARAGGYVVSICAYAAVEGPASPPGGAETYLPRARPAGAPHCIDTTFLLPAKAPVVIRFK